MGKGRAGRNPGPFYMINITEQLEGAYHPVGLALAEALNNIAGRFTYEFKQRTPLRPSLIEVQLQRSAYIYAVIGRIVFMGDHVGLILIPSDIETRHQWSNRPVDEYFPDNCNFVYCYANPAWSIEEIAKRFVHFLTVDD